MAKLNLVGLKEEREQLLNLLFDSGEVQLTQTENFSDTCAFFDEEKYENINSNKTQVEFAINTIERCVQDRTKYTTQPIVVDKENFKNTSNKDVDKVVNKVYECKEKIDDITKQLAMLDNKISAYTPYIKVEERLSSFGGTKTTNIFLGILDSSKFEDFNSFLKDFPLTIFENVDNVIKVYSHKSESQKVFNKLVELGATRCTFDNKDTAKNIILQCENNKKKLQTTYNKLLDEIYSLKDDIKSLKIYYDFLQYKEEKLEADNNFRMTENTYFLTAYLKDESKEKVKALFDSSGLCIDYNFSKITQKDNPPIVLKNNPIVKPFESITNTYSPPNYNELDPNGFIMFFFSVFFGFITADIGYGAILFIGCGLWYLLGHKKNQLMGVLSICGVTSIIFGVLFGSFFGADNSKLSFVPQAILPNPVSNVTTMLIACLGAGIVQIMVSLFLKGVLLLKRKQPLTAFVSGFLWEGFFVGIILLALDMLKVTNGTFNLGLIIAIVFLSLCAFGQIFVNKGIERFTKCFSSIYGLINILSDTLSYARLFGLMLSGAIISSIVDDLALPFFTNFLSSIVGVVILLIGHAFNLFMGGLSAYIHVSRLQYIEFFSRFYEGEGELFMPFGRNFRFINLT